MDEENRMHSLYYLFGIHERCSECDLELICCKNGCGYWNRDVNGATNIYKIAYNAINNKERPNYLSRSKNLSTGLDEPVKPKFTRSAKGKPC